mgnify:CR=1 FL=1
MTSEEKEEENIIKVKNGIEIIVNKVLKENHKGENLINAIIKDLDERHIKNILHKREYNILNKPDKSLELKKLSIGDDNKFVTIFLSKYSGKEPFILLEI